MRFKPKNNKNIKVDKKTIVTLDHKHNDMVQQMKKKEKSIPRYKREREKLRSRLENKEYATVDEKMSIQDQIEELNTKIKAIRQETKDYYLNNSKYIFNYFESKKNITTNENKKKKIVSFFTKREEKEKTEENKTDYSKVYLKNIDDRFLNVDDYIEKHDLCEYCSGELICVENEGILLCNQCSRQHKFLVEPDKPSYKDPPKEVTFYAYKRINHFREILAQFQAKETTQIDDDIIDNIKKQIQKERITLDMLTNEKTKQILKSLGYNKYYEHIPFIKEKLGIKPPTMSLELENRLCNLFLEIQKPYLKYCPNERVNFLNYYYVLYKICELLGEDEYLKHLYMLKDPIKRMEQDEIWKKICSELEWQFIPTI